jgi:flagellar biosynthesis protein FliR
MSFDEMIEFVPVFVLVFFRLAGLMLFAPLLGSARIPRRVKTALALVLAMCMCDMVRLPPLPETHWELALGIAGEIVFGAAMGMILALVFIAAQWGGEMIGQQMGLNLSEVFDPQFSASGSVMGDMYFMLTTVVFLCVGGHLEVIRAVRGSFEVLPLLAVGMNPEILDLLVSLFTAAASLAIRLAAPVLVTMLVVDLALGCISKTMPQFNVMSAGLTLRSLVGMVVLIISIGLGSRVIRSEVANSLEVMTGGWTTPAERVDSRAGGAGGG